MAGPGQPGAGGQCGVRLLIRCSRWRSRRCLLLGMPLAFVLGRLQVDEANQHAARGTPDAGHELQERVDAGLPLDAGQLARSLTDRYVVISEQRHGLARGRRRGPPRHDIQLGDGDRARQLQGHRRRPMTRYRPATSTDGAAAGRRRWRCSRWRSRSCSALLYARRLTRPLQELAGAADRLGSGDARPLGRRYGIQELDRVAEGLDGSAQRINDLLSAERDFAVDASHQLRTPLTALSMRLEEMIAAANYPDVVREEGAAALAQTERLADVVGQLLGRARRSVVRRAHRWPASTRSSAQQVIEWEPGVPAGEPAAGGGRGEGPVRLRHAGRRLPGDRDAAGQRPRARRRHGHDQDVADAGVGGDRGRDEGSGRAAPSWCRGSSSGASAGRRPAPGSGSRWRARWPPPTAARWCWSGRGRRCSRCSCRTRTADAEEQPAVAGPA